MGIVGPRDIAAIEALAQSLQPGPRSVVEHPHPVIRVIHPGGADNGALQDAFFFIVRTDEEIDQRLLRQAVEPLRVAVGLRRTIARAGQEDQRQRRRGKTARFDQQERQTECKIEREPRWRQCRRRAPEEVAHQEREADGRHAQSRGRGLALHGRHEREAGAQQDQRRPERGEEFGQTDLNHGASPGRGPRPMSRRLPRRRLRT